MVGERRGGGCLRIHGVDEELQGILEVEGGAEEGLPDWGRELVIEPRQYPLRTDEVTGLD